jgi:hypothetical protein
MGEGCIRAVAGDAANGRELSQTFAQDEPAFRKQAFLHLALLPQAR